METTTRDNSTRHGLPVLRNRSGHEGASLLFTARRERQFGAGLLSEAGNDGHYVLFRPSKFFGRILSDRVLQLNEALYHFRNEAADHILFLDGDKLQAYYDELNDWIEKVRDRLVVLTGYCNKGFDGRFQEALESVELSGWEGSEKPTESEEESVQPENASEVSDVEVQPENSLEVSDVEFGVKPDSVDVFEAVRQRNVEVGILTELGREGGWVAFHPCPFYGRLIGEIACTLNDALRRLEGRTSFFVASGEADGVRQYYLELKNGITALRGDLEGIIGFCKRKVV